MREDDRGPDSLADKNGNVAKEMSDNIDLSRRSFLTTTGATVGAALAMNFVSTANAADIPSTHTSVSTPKLNVKDYSKIPERTHVYAASDRAKMIVQKSITIDTLFSGVWPSQWSSADAPEFHDEMDRCKKAGFKCSISTRSVSDRINTG